MNWTWLTGRIPGWQMQHEHPREYEQLVSREVAQDATLDATEVGDDSAGMAPGTTPPAGETGPRTP
jgi:hypothetical protein